MSHAVEPRVVALGGGTGLSTLLRGLKRHTGSITAIVTVTDDGGSSGRLRAEMGVLPPGDIRNCLVALADAEPLMKQLFDYRFNSGGPLSGHNFGNLFIAAMSEIMGDFELAVKESSRVLLVRGEVLPATLDDCILGALLSGGREVLGETSVGTSTSRIDRVFLRPEGPKPLPEALRAISEADAIVLGPGSLYTSVMPNLLVDGMADAIASSKAVKIYVCNVMTEPGETQGYAAQEHLSGDELIAEQYRGIRPAPGYPACPDHSAKQDMLALLQCEEIGMGVTESLAMTPAASVSGFYIGHPDSAYFNVGKIGDDQVQDLARRRGVNPSDLQRLLAPNL